MRARVRFSRLRGVILWVGALLVALLLFSQLASAQAPPPPGFGPGPGSERLTVTGFGRAFAPADQVLVRLFVGGEAFYGPGGPEFRPPDMESVDLLVGILEEMGIAKDTLFVNPFGRGTFGPSVTAEVRFLYDQPDELVPLLEKLLEQLEEKRGPKIQQVLTTFLVEDCAALEAEATILALKKAQERAQALADAQADVELGPLLAIEERASASAGFGEQVGGCAALETAALSASPVGSPFLNNAPDEVVVTVSLDVTYALIPTMALGVEQTMPAPGPAPTATPALVPAPVEGKSVVVSPSEMGPSGETRVTVLGGDEEGLREFLEHYLAPAYPGAPAMAITVTVGALPEDLPFQLELPQGLRVIGSLERSDDMDSIQLFLAGALSPAKAVHSLRQQLEKQGYYAPELPFPEPPSVFVPSQTTELSLFCSRDKEWFVSLAALETEEGGTKLRLDLNRAQPFGGPCQEGVVPERMVFPKVLPQLEPPSGAKVQFHGLSTGRDSVQASAEVTTDWPVSRLAAHYEKALEEAGWEQTDSSQTEDLAWSSWRHTDEEGQAWAATFTVTRLAGRPNAYLVWIQVVRAEEG